MKPALLILPALLAISMTGCGSDSTNEKIKGTWVNCSPNDSQGSSVGTSLAFDGGAFTETVTTYSDISCSVENSVVGSTSFSITYILGDGITTAGGLNAQLIDSLVQGSGDGLLTCYDIVGVSGNSLYMGLKNADTDCSTDEKRPVYLNIEQVFFKS